MTVGSSGRYPKCPPLSDNDAGDCRSEAGNALGDFALSGGGAGGCRSEAGNAFSDFALSGGGYELFGMGWRPPRGNRGDDFVGKF